MSVNGCTVSGCTHQTPLLANKTMRRRPGAVTRPEIGARSRFRPGAAGGTVLNAIAGLAADVGRQPGASHRCCENTTPARRMARRNMTLGMQLRTPGGPPAETA